MSESGNGSGADPPPIPSTHSRPSATDKRVSIAEPTDSTAGPGSRKGSTTGPGSRKGSTTEPGSRKGSTTGPGSRKGSTTEPGSRKGSTTEPGSRKGSTTGPGSRKGSTTGPGSRKGSTTGPGSRKGSTTGPGSRKGSTTGPGSRKGSRLRVVEKPLDLDDVLVNELGQFGRFQMMNILLVSLPIIMSAFMSEYIFSAAALPHRCRIPECGEESQREFFEPTWLEYAIPKTDSGFASCERYAPVASNGSLSNCPGTLFNQEITVPCEDGYVYGRFNSVVYDFDLGCQEWLRTLAGTLSSVGTLLVLPITGFISDRYGRRIALVVSVFNLALLGLIRAFSVNYPMYLVMQLLQTTLGAGTYSSAYIFAAELVGPKYRVVTSAITASMFAVGQTVVGGVAWLVQPWRYYILLLHIPCFFVISYYWFLSESVRWLLSKQKFEKARKVLEKVARVNGTHISDKSMNALLTAPVAVETEKVEQERPSLIRAVTSSPVLLRRVFTTPVWWITTTFVYYGLSINSTSLSSTMYLNFILTVLIEIPGYVLAVFVLDVVGRKTTLFSGFMLSAVCNIGFTFIPSSLSLLRLLVYLLGKFSISVVFTSLYLYTSELYPTEYRHSLLAFSSMIGRIGSITAPLTPALMTYWEGIPTLMFGVMGLIAGSLVLTQPETLGTKMPDTLAEAEAIGTPASRVQSNMGRKLF